MMDSFPPAILNAILEGRAILFLGAGASYDALIDGKPTRITSDALRDRLSDKFLGGRFKQKTLLSVADLARNEDSLAHVQEEVRRIFLPLMPNSFHGLIPLFRWKAIVTTNYDLVMERAYQDSNGLQRLAPVTKDGDELEGALKQQNSVPYLKLHGCINNYADTTVPMVLDSTEYHKFAHGRSNLVSTFREWAINNPIIFCGYALGDENIKQILFDIGDASQARPQYLYVSPGLDPIEIRFWQTRRMAAWARTYEEFLNDLDAGLPLAKRKLATLIREDAPTIATWIPSHSQPSDALLQYLSAELKHVLPTSPPAQKPDPAAFFSGLEVSFAPLYENLDVRRLVVDDLLNRVVLDTLKSTAPKFFVLRGYAGCGKSVLTKRLCIETSGLLDKPLVIYLGPRSAVRTELILELQRLVASRLYVFLDDLAEYGPDLVTLLSTVKRQGLPITIFANARTNELSAYGAPYSPFLSGEFEIGDLEAKEVDELLARLTQHRLLGPLQQYSDADRRLFIEKFYNRQLLVALHEITRGASFEEIIVDEFERIVPREAQQIYLDICTLHQCRVPVRSGLISRLSGIPLSDLTVFLQGALSKVVVAEYDHKIRDYVYRSRHEEISRMVFELAVPSPEGRSLQLQRILSSMDINYSSDRKAFFDLLKGRRLADLFDSKALAVRVFEAAAASDPPLSYVNHQRAILELNHKGGDLELAEAFLTKAEAAVRAEGFSPTSIRHTRANMLRRKALQVDKAVERDRYRADARAILKPQLSRRDGSYSETLFGRLLLDEIKDVIAKNGGAPSDASAQTEATVRTINEFNGLVEGHLRDHPADPQMTMLKAEFLEVVGKSPSAMSLLERYCEKNSLAGPVHRVLVEALVKLGRLEEAESMLRPAVIATPGDKSLNLLLARVLIERNEEQYRDAILLHARRSFSDGDSNYDARLLFARTQLLYGDVARGQQEFVALRQPFIQSRDRVRDIVKNSAGERKRYVGKVVSKQAGYGFVTSSELRFNAFLSKSGCKPGIWNSLGHGTKASFYLGFSFRGPVACDVDLDG